MEEHIKAFTARAEIVKTFDEEKMNLIFNTFDKIFRSNFAEMDEDPVFVPLHDSPFKLFYKQSRICKIFPSVSCSFYSELFKIHA